MIRSRALRRRVAVGLVAIVVLALLAYIAVRFVAAVVFAIFLYYAVRPIFNWLDQFGLSRRSRAALALTLFGLPFLFLVLYTVAIVSLEVQSFLQDAALVDQLVDEITARLDGIGLNGTAIENNVSAIQQLIGGAGAQVLFGATIANFTGVVSAVGSLLVQLLIVVLATYYMLVDGPRLLAWLCEEYDESGVITAYIRAVDPELSETLFGNIVNVFVTAILAVATFYTYNLFVPGVVEVPYPVLAGALAGIASLIPAVGIKIVYIPITVGLALKTVLEGDLGLLVPVAVLAGVSAVLVDFVPDVVVRAQISGGRTHNGLLMLSYIAGPSAFGFYGLFLAPILLVLSINAVEILLPYALTGEVPDSKQTRLDAYADRGTHDSGASE